MKQVTAFETTDGKLFHEEHEAKEHESLLDMEETLNASIFYHGGGLCGITDTDDLWKFLDDNKKVILAFMNWQEKGAEHG